MSDDKNRLQPIREVVKQMIGKVPSTVTMWRWCNEGSDGAILGSRRIAGKVYTSIAWFEEWIEQQNKKD